MKIEGNRLTFSKKLDVKYSGNVVEETDEFITLEGEDEDSYLKVYSPFQGVAQLFLFENDTWADANAANPMGGMPGMDFGGLDLSALGDLAGDLPEDPSDEVIDATADSEIVDVDGNPLDPSTSEPTILNADGSPVDKE